MSNKTLEDEAERLAVLLKGKVVSRLDRHRASELLVEFSDGTRLFVTQSNEGLELSVTGGVSE